MDQRRKDETLMRAALSQAEKALAAGEFPVGCVIADDREIIAAGARESSRGQGANEIDHAEIVALKRLYESGRMAEGRPLTIYTTMEPCLMCFGAILIAGVKRIVFAFEDAMGGGTACRLAGMPPLYSHIEVEIVAHVLREESLDLFHRFFSDAANAYLKETLLAEYTLGQK